MISLCSQNLAAPVPPLGGINLLIITALKLKSTYCIIFIMVMDINIDG